jgi:hypothetical protein
MDWGFIHLGKEPAAKHLDMLKQIYIIFGGSRQFESTTQCVRIPM